MEFGHDLAQQSGIGVVDGAPDRLDEFGTESRQIRRASADGRAPKHRRNGQRPHHRPCRASPV